MPLQYPVSLQIPILPDKVDAVRTLLQTGGNPQKTQSFFDFEKLNSVHFARWIITPAKDNIASSLIYAANVDGDETTHLTELVDSMPDDLDQVFEHCPGYPIPAERSSSTRLDYLQKHKIKTQGFYAGAPNRTVEQVKNEAKLYEAVRTFVKEKGQNWKSAHESYEAIKEHLANDPQWDWAREHYALPKVNIPMTIFLVLVVLALLPLILLGIIIIHFFYEPFEKPFGKSQNQIPVSHLKAVKSQEDKIYQNQLSQVFEMKSGIRKIQLRFFLWVASFGARNIFVKGQLFGTPTIHFARWVVIDGGKRFVFFSNFDGSFDEYLGDFVDNNGWGLNAIYSASVGYPRTFFMFGEGSYNIIEFLGWGRISQVTTPLWYSAYPTLGLQQIVSKSELRTKLFNSGDLNDKQIKAMLRRI